MLFFSFEVVCFFSRLVFFIVRPAIIKKKKNILMTQRAEGIRVEKTDMPNLINCVEREGRVGRVVYRCRVRVTVRF